MATCATGREDYERLAEEPTLTRSPIPSPAQELTLLLVVFFPGLGVVLLWGRTRLLGLLA